MVRIHWLVLAFSAAVLYGALTLASVTAAESPPAPASKSESVAYKASEFAANMWQSGKESALKAWEATKEAAQRRWHSGKETAREGLASGKQTAEGAWDATKQKSGEVTRDLKEGWKDGTK